MFRCVACSRQAPRWRLAPLPYPHRGKSGTFPGANESGEVTALIRVVIVDDETLVRSGLSLIVGSAPDIEVVATCSGGEAVDVVGKYAPQVVLLDIRMPDVDGLTV